MCVCVCVCEYMCVRKGTCVCVCMCVCEYGCLCEYICVRQGTCVCMCVCICVCLIRSFKSIMQVHFTQLTLKTTASQFISCSGWRGVYCISNQTRTQCWTENSVRAKTQLERPSMFFFFCLCNKGHSSSQYGHNDCQYNELQGFWYYQAPGLSESRLGLGACSQWDIESPYNISRSYSGTKCIYRSMPC